ncbi:MAG: Rieske 2Fe-2S domain-containing protein [Acidobacteria bacterium]|nr:Rieske 2Fe-2S domain-containing protein [Acidobacteriota bacterium]
MSGTSITILATIGLVILAALVLFGASRRRDAHAALSRETVKKDRSVSPFLEAPASARDVERAAVLANRAPGTALEPVGETAPVPYVAPDPETIGVTRRQFFNRSMVAMMILGLSGFGGSVLAFLWPSLSGGFGSKVKVGKLEDLLTTMEQTRQPVYLAEARTWLSPYPKDAIPKAKKAYSGAVLTGMESGVVALYQKCVHLGCRVPFCATSQWFECGCHGSQYNRVGEKKGGPAPRGLDRFAVTVDGGVVTVDTGALVVGPPIGINTTGQEAEGPHCVNPAGGHH